MVKAKAHVGVEHASICMSEENQYDFHVLVPAEHFLNICMRDASQWWPPGRTAGGWGCGGREADVFSAKPRDALDFCLNHVHALLLFFFFKGRKKSFLS